MTDTSTVFDAAFEYQMNGMSEENAHVAASEFDAKNARIAQLEAALLAVTELLDDHCIPNAEMDGDHFLEGMLYDALKTARAALKDKP